MIKFESNPKENKCVLNVRGDMKTLLAEVMYMIKTIYDGYEEQNEEAAERFKKLFLTMTADGLPFNIDDIEEEEDDDEDEDEDEILDKLIDVLREVLCS